MQRTYTWEHATDESRWLRSGAAADLCCRSLIDAGELGVIIDDNEGPLRVLALNTEGLTVRQVRRALVRLGR